VQELGLEMMTGTK
jgi:hypothetical protein